MMKKTVYCAFCKIKRSIIDKKHTTWTNSLFSVGLAFVLSYSIWHVVDERVLYLAIVFMIMSETYVQLRWRMSVACPHCGFDPALYLRNADKAAEKVRVTLQAKRESLGLMQPEKNPFKNLAVLAKPAAAKQVKQQNKVAQKKGRQVSIQA